MIWHSNSIPDVLQELQVDPTAGLTQQEADKRLKEYGKNSLQEQKSASFRQAFTRQVRSPLIVLLWIMAAITLLTDLYNHFLREIPTDWKRSLVVAGITLVIALFNALRRCRAAASLTALQDLSIPDARVRRDGKEQLCPIPTLVPGDIVLLGVGDLVPADCRIIEADRLRCDECELTEATMPAEKYADPIFDDITPLAQRTNMLYAGTAITGGTATAVVVATGIRSEMGRSTAPSPVMDLPKQKTMQKWRMRWILGVTILCVIALIIGLCVHTDRIAVFLTVATLAMVAIPQNVDDLITNVIARCVRRIAHNNVRLNHPQAAQTMGKVTVICADQDTLFENNNLTLDWLCIGTQWISLSDGIPNQRGVAPFMRLAVLNSTAGNLIDDAILKTAATAGIHRDELLTDMPCIGELTPTAERHTSVHLAGDQTLILVSGEWRSLLPLCTKSDVERLTKEAELMEKDCGRVMVVAYRLTDTAPTVYTAEELEHDLTCAGLLGWHTPWQLNIEQTTASLPNVRVLLFSDKSVTSTQAIARQLLFIQHPHILTGETVSTFNEEDWNTAVQQYDVYCGLTAQQKQQVVFALQRQGEVVAVTGGHSNEVELLTTADVGFARGTIASDVAKSAADAVLEDDSYITLLDSIYEGKRLKRQIHIIGLYVTVCALALVIFGLIALVGWMSLQYQAIWMLCLHLVLFVLLPIPAWNLRDMFKKK
ncbi:MAG: cation-transporting P-type ATPase [Clostridia bacterium]|nr:cation-transporting P-type ATPase [Clostridia bacterium]